MRNLKRRSRKKRKWKTGKCCWQRALSGKGGATWMLRAARAARMCVVKTGSWNTRRRSGQRGALSRENKTSVPSAHLSARRRWDGVEERGTDGAERSEVSVSAESSSDVGVVTGDEGGEGTPEPSAVVLGNKSRAVGGIWVDEDCWIGGCNGWRIGVVEVNNERGKSQSGYVDDGRCSGR